ncbi:enoyl-CoA hydratase/isomerase family protein [Actinomadura madurae]|uniref:enoyl-CoA hydratase-related protein n=1 Tax=Actinomadura madurae TaxID=1993 RepID=UPI003999D1EB
MRWDVADRIATITFNRPEVANAQNPDTEAEFVDLLTRADEDPAVRAIVITGAGKTFCVGGDAAYAKGVIEGYGWAGSIPRPMEAFALRVRKPVVAAINGACAGLGLVFAATCDVRFAARGANFSTAFARRGLPAERGLSWTLPKIVGYGHASDILLSGRKFGTDEAERMGLVNRVVEPGDLMSLARSWALDAAENCAPGAMATIKRQLLEDSDRSLAEALADAGERATLASQGDGDFREGFISYLENRPAAFADLPSRFDARASFALSTDS